MRYLAVAIVLGAGHMMGRGGPLRKVTGEIAAAAPYLACADSSFVAGSELYVDGGMAQV